MGGAIGDVLSNGIGVALSPVPILAVIVMLFSDAGARNGSAFVLGWVLGLVTVCVVLMLLAPEPDQDGPSTAVSVGQLVIGVLFLALAGRQWANRPRGDAVPTPPAWMSAVVGFSGLRSLGLGVVLVVANPKNLGLAASAGGTIASTGLSVGRQVVVLAVFVLVGSLTILVPVTADVVAPGRTEPVLLVMRSWLAQNSATIMTVTFLLLGTKILGQGLQVLD